MLFCNIDVLDEGFILKRGQYVGTREGMIDYIGPEHGAGQAAPGRAAEDPARVADAASGVLLCAGLGPAAVPVLLPRPLRGAAPFPAPRPALRPEILTCGRIT